MTDWVKKRTGIIKKLDTIMQVVNAHNTNPLSEIDVHAFLEDLTDWKKDFKPVQEELIQLCTDDAAIDVQMKVEAKANEQVRIIRNKLGAILRSIPSMNNSSSSSSSSATADVKLPRIDLPTFSGSYLDWTSFHDLFNSIVHSNNRISPSQKLHYLKNSLRGEASGLIQSLDITDANYIEAWNLLKARYEDKRQIIYSHMDMLFNQPAITSESAFGLRKLLDTTTKHIRSLHVLGADDWDKVMVHLVSKRLDSETRKQWELHSPGTGYPSYTELEKFLNDRCKALEASGNNALNAPRKPQPTLNSNISRPAPKINTRSHHVSSVLKACPFCKATHHIFKCDEFTKLDVAERNNHARKNKLCYNCLRGGHSVSQCESKSTCRKCNSKHHTLLHSDTPAPSTTSSQASSTSVSSHFSDYTGVNVLLATAKVNVEDAFGNKHCCRVLLDNGSQASFVTESLVQKLGIRRSKSTTIVNGIGQSGSGRALGVVKLILKSQVYEFNLHVSALILKKVTGKLPSCKVNTSDWSHIRSLKLADPNFDVPGEIDILLGADVHDLLTMHGKVERTNEHPSAQHTQLGWVLTGTVGQKQNDVSVHFSTLSSHFSRVDIQDQLAKFWTLEEVPQQSVLTEEEKACEKHFTQSHSRDSTGRYIVALPFKNTKCLGSSRDLAIKRLQHTERRLDKLVQHKETYHAFMEEYLSLGHMQLIPPEEINSENNHFYLPHHFVLKESSSTTALRVVFDGSAKTTNGISLNDTLMVGQKLQPDIFDILLRFRFYKFVFTADISKMFRQIQVKNSDCDFQRIVWRDSPTSPVQDYRLTTVTYGTATGPYLATRALQQVAADEGAKFPLAKEVVLRDFYVDDVMSGADDLQLALRIQQQLIELLKLGGFDLRKWTSNNNELIEALPEGFRAPKSPLQIESDDSIKALGLHWHPTNDYFFFKVNLDRDVKVVSKRKILSDVAKLFDPLGWLSPVVLIGKVLFQKLWIEGISWDDSIPHKLEEEWLKFRHQLFKLEDLTLSRHFGDAESYQLHGFCDASETAYGAAVYIRTQHSTADSQSHLLCSKPKVAPTKTISIPRLELCGAALLARLLHKVKLSLNINISSVHAWTDSTVTLAWISGLPNKWKTFVANRVTEIQELLPPAHWRHVRTEDNPADMASRGVMPSDILNNQLWWHGPDWLRLSDQSWPQQVLHHKSQLEERIIKSHLVQIPEFPILQQYSTLSKLQRVTAWCLRFNNNSRTTGQHRSLGPLSVKELQNSLFCLIRIVQQQYFKETIRQLLKKQNLTQHASLSPFIDSQQLLRVGGRLSQGNMAFDKKHPILLPKNCILTNLIIQHEHRIQLHAGPQLLLACLRHRYWIVDGRNLVRQHVLKCIKCFRERASSIEQRMGDLPAHRLEPARPFLRTGVDYAGPISIKSIKGRGGKILKSYIALFVCCATKAVHLELVTDLSSECFIAALTRFISRRGLCSDIYSDNGTNFVGASNELRELYQLVHSATHNQKVVDHLSTTGITWHFIPARAPHFGGLWEAGVKSVKQHLRRVIGNLTLTLEEFYTILTQIEACLNSRPLTPMTTDPNDLSVLTPGHFLIGAPLTSFPEPDLTQLNNNRLSRFQLLKQTTQHFWKRWSLEYLSQPQQRPKWQQTINNINTGDLVLVKEDNTPPLQWVMARVTETFPGNDGCVRVANVKTAKGILKRPIAKLCLLPNQD